MAMHGMKGACPMSNSDSLSGAAGKGPIEQIREGMHVVDSAGEDVGTVSVVQMGDPEAATVEGEESGGEGFLGGVANAFGFEDEPDLPPTLQARLMRFGFIKVDGKGLFAADRYVRADRIDGVSGDTVRLSVSKDRISEED